MAWTTPPHVEGASHSWSHSLHGSLFFVESAVVSVTTIVALIKESVVALTGRSTTSSSLLSCPSVRLARDQLLYGYDDFSHLIICTQTVLP